MHPSRLRSALIVVLGLLALVASGLVALAAPASAASTDVRINEFSSNNPDFVELINIGSTSVDLTGWVLKDNSENNSYTFPAGSSIAAGAIKGISGEGVEFAFGLGNGDSVRLFAPGGVLIDSVDYPAHPPAGKSYSRCPQGTGPFVTTGSATKGTANDCGTPPAVKINEFSSNNPDFVELVNTTGAAVDLTGWVLKDNSENNSYTFPAGSSIAAGALKALSGEGVDFAFGLGNGDSVRLFAPGGVLADSFDYPAHPPAGKSYSRCPAGTGAFVTTGNATKGTANDCPAAPTTVKINEFSSNNPDFVELINTGSAPVDLAGWVLKDNTDNNSYTFPAGSSIAGGARLALSGEGVDFLFGLGNGDSVRLFAPGGVLIDSYDYPAHPPAGKSYSRCPEGTGSFVTTGAATRGAANDCTVQPAIPDVKVNEVESNGDQVADWVELKNNSASSVDVSGWKIVDGDPAHAATPVVVPAGTSIPAGGYYAIYTEVGQSPGFGLGVGDSVNLYLPDGSTLVDTTTWGPHAATTWGRCPDGTGPFGDTTTPTRGLPNACSPIRINEIESSGGVPGDWIELKNISAGSVDVGGWSVKDSGESPYTIPAGTTIAGGGYLVLDEAQFVFGLGGNDAVRLFDNTGALIESYAWTTAATQTYGRCKDGVGGFVDTKAPTKGAANSCPGLETLPWPGGQTVGFADQTGTFVQDLSGLVFDPADPDVLWAAQNKKGTLFKLVRDGSNDFVPAAGWPRDPKFANGQGSPDTEGITIGPDGFVYLTTERDNDASGVSRNTVLRFDPNAPAGATITPTTEWNLTPLLPAVGANLGLEGITFVPDGYLTANGFKDQSTGAAYSPATYPGHGSGLFFVAYENNGHVYAFALDSDGTPHKVADIESGFAALADVDFDPELQRVRAVTDDTFDGRTSLLKIGPDGAFVVDAAYDRPAGMPNLNNEGLAVAPQSRCTNGFKEVVWSDDGDTDGHSLRRGTISCTALQAVAFTSTAPVGAVVGQTYDVTVTGGGSGNPVTVSVSPVAASVCTLTAGTVTFTHPGTCVLRAQQAAGPGYEAGEAIQTVDVGKAPQTITFPQPGNTVVGGPAVPVSATSDSGLPVILSSSTPAVCAVSGGTVTPVAAGTCTINATQAGDDDHLAASPVARSLTVAKAAQTITFTQPGGTVYGGSPVALTAVASSGLPVAFASTTPAVCLVSGSTVTPVGAGTCSVTATQGGNTDYLAATPVVRSLTVAKAGLVVTTRSTSGLQSLLTLRITYTSTVRSAVTGLPVAGVPVTTRINGGSPTSGCTATTNAVGVATCTVGPISIALGVTYTASVPETANYLAGAGQAFIGLL